MALSLLLPNKQSHGTDYITKEVPCAYSVSRNTEISTIIATVRCIHFLYRENENDPKTKMCTDQTQNEPNNVSIEIECNEFRLCSIPKPNIPSKTERKMRLNEWLFKTTATKTISYCSTYAIQLCCLQLWDSISGTVHKIGFACQRRNESLMNREVNAAQICGPVHANQKRQ